jgi:geranylgeranyl pyrophosphate synthase
MNENLSNFFKEVSSLVNREMQKLIPEQGEAPGGLREAIRWSLFGGGKRFRPTVVFASGRMYGLPDDKLIKTAVAVEFLHTYSLIHDDLPAMDNDDYRRGRETCHKKFGEAAAILAGDALQALSFQLIAEDQQLDFETRSRLTAMLGSAAARMAAGQYLDLIYEGKKASLDEIQNIHRNKTGALIKFCVLTGPIIANAGIQDFDSLEKFADQLGLLFQITDDLLDVTGTTEKLGKTAGKDLASFKATYPNCLGIDRTRKAAGEVHSKALEILEELGPRSQILREITDFLLYREN